MDDHINMAKFLSPNNEFKRIAGHLKAKGTYKSAGELANRGECTATELTISDQRNQLGMKMIEALTCLKSWYKLKDWDKLESLLCIGHVIQPMYSVGRCR
jgi:hypothetical protein